MKTKRALYSKAYETALRKGLRSVHRPAPSVAESLGARAVEAGLDARDITRIHHRAMSQIASGDELSAALANEKVRNAWNFFADAIASLEKHRRAATPSPLRQKQRSDLMQKRLDAALRRGDREIGRRKAADEKLKQTQLRHSKLLQESRELHEQMRGLSHRILLSQEAERKEISRELHDQIAQTLTGINVHLAALKIEDALNTRELARKITKTQRIVEKSVNIVHRFARDLRPTVLDDLGLIPALQSLLKEYTERTGLPVKLDAFSGANRINGDKQTVLYRVAQAALSNVGQHAKASRVSIDLRKVGDDILMDIRDNGKSFDVEKVLYAKRHKRLGVLGMRERVQMVGGVFSIESAPGQGTKVQARIPFANGVPDSKPPGKKGRGKALKR